jgi:hypothetical protein
MYSANCCTIDSLYCVFPECLGCYSKQTNCCIEQELIAYKAMCCTPEKEKKSLMCIVAKQSCNIIRPTTCVKQVNQCCCCDSRVAFPCDEEVPCIYMPMPFCTCCVCGSCVVGCCQNLETIKSKSSKLSGAKIQPH